jgi:hypothetical protein
MLLSDAMVDREGEQEGTSSETIVGNLVELSRKTALVARRLDSTAVKALFAELEEHDSQERDETFNFLKRALNETRSSLGAELLTRMGRIIEAARMKVRFATILLRPTHELSIQSAWVDPSFWASPYPICWCGCPHVRQLTIMRAIDI